MTGSTSVDVSKIFETKISCDVSFDTFGDVKIPRIDKPDFSVGGLDFHLSTRNIVHKKYTYAVYLELDEASKTTLADGDKVMVTNAEMTSRGQRWDLSVKGCVHDPFYLYSWDSERISVLTIRFALKFGGLSAFRLQFVDAELAKKHFSDCKMLLVDDGHKEVFVNKQFLAYQSPYFRRVFFDDSKKKNQKVFQLDEVTEEDFLEYLYCVYPPPNRPLAFKRLEALLRLAHRFENETLKSSIKKFMMEKKDMPSNEKRQALILSDTYRIPEVFRATLGTMGKTDLKPLRGATCKKFGKDNLELLLARVFGIV